MEQEIKKTLQVSGATKAKYLKNLLNQLDNLRSAMEKSDTAGVREICHRVQGSAGLFGMKDLGEACRAMEEACIAGEHEKMVEAFQVVEVIITRNAGGPLDSQVSA